MTFRRCRRLPENRHRRLVLLHLRTFSIHLVSTPSSVSPGDYRSISQLGPDSLPHLFNASLHPILILISSTVACSGRLHRASLAGPHSTPKSSSQRVSSVSRASVQLAWTAACCLFRSASSVSDSIGGFKPYLLLPSFGWPLLDLSGSWDLVFQVFESTSELSVPLKR